MDEPEKKKYKKNFLSQIIFQLMFDQIDSFNDESMKHFHEQLKDKYSELSSIKQQGIILHNDGSTINAEQEDKLIWQLVSKDGTHNIVVGQDNFVITITSYTTFRDYENIIHSATDAFLSQFNSIKTINRLGLRYVNQIRPQLPMTKWSDYLSSKLTDSLGFVPETKLRRSMHGIVLLHDEDTQLNINYGIFNQYFPAPIVDKEFILDIDAYTPTPISTEDIKQRLEKFNKTIAIYFELSIKEKLREEMEVINE